MKINNDCWLVRWFVNHQRTNAWMFLNCVNKYCALTEVVWMVLIRPASLEAAAETSTVQTLFLSRCGQRTQPRPVHSHPEKHLRSYVPPAGPWGHVIRACLLYITGVWKLQEAELLPQWPPDSKLSVRSAWAVIIQHRSRRGRCPLWDHPQWNKSSLRWKHAA